ncbi:MAG: PEGA domain-containing protein [Flavobacteriales bacterium]
MSRVGWFVVAWAALVLAGCQSSVLITSYPTDAYVTLDGQLVGKTPYQHTDRKISGYNLGVKLEKHGFETEYDIVKRTRFANPAALISGCFLLFPLAWTLDYPAVVEFRMEPNLDEQTSESNPVSGGEKAEGVVVTIKEEASLIRNVFVVAVDARNCAGLGDALMLEEQAGVRLLRHYDVLERRDIDAVLDESQRSMNGLFDEDSVVEAGLLAGAEGVVLLRESCLAGAPYFSAKLVDCQTGRQVWAGTAEGESLGQLMETITGRLAAGR